jgi:hypothetical protein
MVLCLDEAMISAQDFDPDHYTQFCRREAVTQRHYRWKSIACRCERKRDSSFFGWTNFVFKEFFHFPHRLPLTALNDNARDHLSPERSRLSFFEKRLYP